ncbi:MAG: hypothetical protein EPN23_03080 [Verrucomicrobia bacterium]|nr:MAG: hypothetical protein EPN23_03080 [Verrucomicrobiota bacterium]
MLNFFKKDQTARRRLPNEVVGLDFGTTSTKAVRLRKSHEEVTLVAADILPAINLNANARPSLPLPPKLVTNYAAVALSSNQQVVRLVNVSGTSGAQDPTLGPKLQEMVKVESHERLAYTVLLAVPAKRETLVLTVALPEAEIAGVLSMLAHGPPAALSVENASLAALTAFYHGPGRTLTEESVCFIDSGAQTTFVAFLRKGIPVLVRTLDLGGEHLVQRLQTQWGLDRETAMGTLGQSTTIDVSQPVHELAGSFLRQLSISRDFVERQENCRITRAYLSGGMSLIRHWVQEIHDATGMEAQTWDPFQNLIVPPNAMPPAMDGQTTRWAAAVGAALAVFEEA